MDLYDQVPKSKLAFLPEHALLLESSRDRRITVTDLLTLKPAELAKILPRSINDIAQFQQALKSEYKEVIFGRNKSRRLVQDTIEIFTSGDVEIDRVLGGGIRTHGITEIFGSSSTGKSQFLMQLSLSVQASVERGGLNAKCVFITTEGSISTRRLDEMIDNKSKLPGFELLSQNNIFTVNCNDLANQEHILQVQLPILLERNSDIRLVIIDSISHHLRVELERKTFRESQDNRRYIDHMAQDLLKLAADHSLAVVVANQVGDKPVPEPSTASNMTDGVFTDYSYQLGWTVGWKDSSIYYRQVREGLLLDSNSKVQTQPRENIENILSDDEEYNVVAEAAFARKRPLDGENTKGEVRSASQPLPTTHTSDIKVSSPRVFFPSLGRKRAVETKVPNLGLSWSNHLSARILLSKSYKASPSVRKGEFNLNEMMDTSNFWQVRRTLRIVFSEYAEKQDIDYIISAEGIKSVKQVQQDQLESGASVN
ncbi:LAME_0G11166g1_1 [Lachancea meyersii CBS 8951]|uniref:LAME_0G11166g1_1 n=1 Tax=Lachancea meyersii CBS 8951 TaxID=1266667 RepID=A0A1G4K9A6_9SACH|nr:LAME_0G11166g1_1 [Lachancea meyersii CBS 8951]